jgi:glutathionyl-hydroquinone reductase
MLATRFGAFARRHVDLYPAGLDAKVNRWSRFVHAGVNTAVYRVSFAPDFDTHQGKKWALFGALERLEDRLGECPYLAGGYRRRRTGGSSARSCAWKSHTTRSWAAISPGYEIFHA